ncbi:Hypothetical protein FSTVST1_467 [Faustovirus ST1]|nr:Hypothetical protein FSTVST1_467 [Faustovirus ST1]
MVDQVLPDDTLVLIALCDWRVFKPMCCVNSKLHKTLDYNTNKLRWKITAGLWSPNIAQLLESNYFVALVNRNNIYIFKSGLMVKKINIINTRDATITHLMNIWRYRHADNILYEEHVNFANRPSYIYCMRIKRQLLDGNVLRDIECNGHMITSARLDFEAGFFLW